MPANVEDEGELVAEGVELEALVGDAGGEAVALGAEVQHWAEPMVDVGAAEGGVATFETRMSQGGGTTWSKRFLEITCTSVMLATVGVPLSLMTVMSSSCNMWTKRTKPLSPHEARE